MAENRKQALEISKLKACVHIYRIEELISAFSVHTYKIDKALFKQVWMHLYTCIQAQLSSSSQSLTAAREEIKKCELQLKTQQQEHEAKMSRMHKKFTGTIQELEARVRKPSLTL